MLPENDFYISDRLVQPQLNRISGPDGRRQIEPKVMEVLLCLAERPGKVISREELLSRVWRDTVVVETTVFRAVSELRRTFADNPREPRTIETVRKKGYRLIAAVTPAVQDLRAIGDFSGTPALQPACRPSAVPRSVAPLRVVPSKSETTSAAVGQRLWRNIMSGAGAVGLVAFVVVQFRASIVEENSFLTSFEPPTVITSSAGFETVPSLSPDGRGVAFVKHDGASQKIEVKFDDEDEARTLTSGAALESGPIWSPDGREIAFWRIEKGIAELVVTAVLGGPVRCLLRTRHRPGGCGSWSPDGRAIVVSYRGAREEPRSIFLVSSDGSRPPRQWTAPPEGWFGDVAPAFSPDGKNIAFIRSRVVDRGQDIYIVSSSGGEPRRLTFDEKPIRGLDWRGPKTLIVSSKRSHQYALWSVSIETGTLLFTGIVDARYPSLSKSGDLLAYEHKENEINIWELDLTTGITGETPLIASTRNDFAPHYRGDGRAIAFSSERTGHHEIWVCDDSGDDCRQQTNYRQFASRPRFSPDGRRLAFHADRGGDRDIFVIDAPQRPARLLTRNPANDEMVAWSSDGSWVYFASDRSGSWQVWKVPSGGGVPQIVTRNGGFMSRESPDGRFLYFTRPLKSGLWRKPVEGGEEELVLKRFPRQTSGNWEFVGDELIFAVADSEGARVIAYCPETGSSSVLARLPIPMAVDLTVSPVRHSLLFTRVDRRESDILRVRLPAP